MDPTDKLPFGEIPKGAIILKFPKKGRPPEPENALDVLKLLIKDIEEGKTDPPDMIYIAMRVEHPVQKGTYAYPFYQWGPESSGASLLMSGLLHKHLQRL